VSECQSIRVSEFSQSAESRAGIKKQEAKRQEAEKLIRKKIEVKELRG